jgi:hypothetical protein
MQNSRCNPTHLGFPHSPFKAQFIQCAPQLAFKGKFVNPLEPVAIISFSKQRQAQKPSLTSFHYNSLRPSRSARRPRFFPFHSVRSVFRAFSSKLKGSTKASAFLSPKSLPKPLPGRHRQYSETAKGTKLFAHSILTPIRNRTLRCTPRPSATLRFIPFAHPFKPFLQTCKASSVARASFLSPCRTSHHTARANHSSQAHPPYTILSRANIQLSPVFFIFKNRKVEK